MQLCQKASVMAKLITDEEIRLSIAVNGNQAQKELYNLEKSTKTLNAQNKELRAEKQKLMREGQRESARYKELTAQIKENSATIYKNTNRMNELQKQIGVSSLTMSQLTQRITVLKATLRQLIPNTPDWIRYNNELKLVNARLSELSGKARATQSSLSSLADGFNKYQALALGFVATLTGVVLSLQKMIDSNAELSDAQSDVMKTTGMTKKEVDELTKSFGLLKTRTARTELLALATEAGRLGITGVENVKAFVEQANKMKVALGDDLSDEQIREVGKMVNVYKVGEATGKDFASAMDALGSAINEVAASGANQASFQVDYLKRQAGVASLVKLSADQNIGYAATFDQLGQSAEVSATAMNKVWLDMAKNPQNFAKVVGLSVSEFKTLMEKDANQAMMMFLQAINKNKSGASDLLNSLKDIEAGGVRGDQAILALAQNINVLTNYQNIANTALSEATSLTNEYNLKNNNLAATLAKIKKTMMGWFSSETILNGLSDFFSWFAKLIGATEDLDGSVTRFRDRLIVFLKVLAIIITSYISYNAALRLNALWTNRNVMAQAMLNMIKSRGVIITNTLKAAYLYLSARMYLMTGNTQKAAAAMQALNTTMRLNPFGLILGLLATLATAFFIFRKRTDEAVKSVDQLAKLNKIAADEVSRQKAELSNLLSIAKDETAAKKDRIWAIKELNRISPKYLGNLTLETINTKEAKKAIDKYNESLLNTAKIKAATDVLQENQKKQMEIELDYQAKTFDKMQEYHRKGINDTEEYYKEIRKIAVNQKKWEEERDKKLKPLKEQENQILGVIRTAEKGKNTNPFDDENNNGTGGNTTKTKYDDSYLDKERQFAEQLRKLVQESESERLQIMLDSYEKDMAMQQAKHKHSIEDLEEEVKAKQVIINQIDEEILKAQKDKDNKKVDSLKRSKQYVLDIQDHLNNKITHQEAIHKLEMGKIQEKWGKEILDNLKEEYEKQKQLREMAFDIEMSQTHTKANERARKKREFQQNELQKEKEYYQSQINILNDILNNTSIDGVDFDLLPESVKEKLRNDLDYLKAVFNSLKNPGGEELNLGISNDADILGFNQDQWDKFFVNLQSGTIGIQTMGMAIQAAQNLWGQFDAYLSASENAQLQTYERNQDKRKRALKQQLDQGYINQVQYKRRIEEVDQDLDRKKAEIEYQQAKRQRMMAVTNVISNTAQAIMSIWAQVPKFDFGATASILTGIVGATGALQLATILKQPLPARGYEEGLYDVIREQDKKPFKATYGGNIKTGKYTKPTILVGEGPGSMPEMIIDKQAYAQISPATKQALEQELRMIKGFENGLYDILKQNKIQPNNNDTINPMVLQMLQENIRLLRQLKEEGIMAKVLANDYESLDKLNEGMKRYKELMDRAKR